MIFKTIALFLLAGSVGHAAVVDEFACEFSYQKNTGASKTSVAMNAAVVRQPLNRSPSPDVRLTGAEGDFFFSNLSGDGSVSGGMTFSYTHAIEYDANYNAKRAVMSGCVSLSLAEACTHDPKQPCSAIGTSCAIFDGDPFDPITGWAPVELRNGVPLFTAKTPIEAVLTGKDGTLKVECQYKRTLD